MRGVFAVVVALSLAGCAYMTRDRFDELYDQDGDGWGVDEDCNDLHPLVYPFAPDVRGDSCDADCGEEPDADGDDWPDDADCAPDDATIYPCAPDAPDDGIDQDCDGTFGPRPADQPCNTASGFPDALGLDPDFPPAKGATGTTSQLELSPDCMNEDLVED
jgi:hypothetical protein